MVTLFLSLPLPDDGGRLVRHHFGDAAEMICPLRKARGWVRCPAWAKDEGRSDRQCAMPGNADLLDCQGQPQPPPLRSGKHTTIAQQESGRILSSIWRQVVGAIPIGGPRQLKRMFAQEPILNPSLLTAGKTAPDRRVIRHQLHRPHLSTMCPRAAIKAAIPRRQTGNEK